MAKDYYSILGVAKGATPEEIKKAFRKKAHEHHPDKSGGNTEKFKELNEAYQVLGDADKRKRYDQFGSGFAGQAGPGFSSQGFGNWSDFARQSGSGAAGFDFSDLGEIFGDWFGQRTAGPARSKRESRGADLEASVVVTLEEAVFGTEKILQLNKEIICPHCQGNGAEPGTAINDCKTCRGSGQVSTTQNTFFGSFRSVGLCPACQGEGRLAEKKCSQCHGRGLKKSSESLKVKIPAGINSGESLKLSGQGEAGSKGARAGDLYINIQVLPHPDFFRQGDNLVTTKVITFATAVLGDKVRLKTLDGEVKLKIPAGTKSNQEFIIKNKGVTRLRGHGRGDLLVKIELAVPNSLSREQKKLMEELKNYGL